METSQWWTCSSKKPSLKDSDQQLMSYSWNERRCNPASIPERQEVNMKSCCGAVGEKGAISDREAFFLILTWESVLRDCESASRRLWLQWHPSCHWSSAFLSRDSAFPCPSEMLSIRNSIQMAAEVGVRCRLWLSLAPTWQLQGSHTAAR